MINTALNLNRLNIKQYEAVTAPLTSILVLAGAGSGKTRVLTHRIAWLIQQQNLLPYDILSMTFTNKAAAEMRTRIDKLLSTSTQSMWLGTFHSIAHRLLRTHWRSTGLAAEFQIIDSDDQLKIIKHIMKSLQINNKLCQPLQAKNYINKQKEAGLRPENIDIEYNQNHRIKLSIYTSYHHYCNKNNLVDFAELLLKSYELLSNNPDILSHYRKRFKYILVDEFQDTNSLQYAWLYLLANGKNNLMIVGDDDQSIYGWRGARVENMHQFATDFPQAITVNLEQNYRSTSVILKAANAVISHNKKRFNKTLWTDNKEKTLINLFAANDEYDEVMFIIKQIQNTIKTNINLSHIDILYRSNAQSRLFEKLFNINKIPYRIYGGQRFFSRTEIKHALAYMTLIAYPDNNIAIERIINIPPRGIGKTTIERLKTYSNTHHQSIWEIINNLDHLDHRLAQSKSGKSILKFIEMINNLRQQNTQDLATLMKKILLQSELITYYKQEKDANDIVRIDNLNELVTACAQFKIQDDSLTTNNSDSQSYLKSFLSGTALGIEEDTTTDPQNAVQIMTIHSAKGLEFPVVFIVGTEENLFPHVNAINNDDVDEERRLCYVGITRAMKQLTITYANTRMLYDRKEYQIPSRFINEIPEDLILKISNNIVSKITHKPAYTPNNTFKNPIKATSNTNQDIAIGQRIKHAIFGNGSIIEYAGNKEKTRVSIHFDKSGQKWLMLSYIKLEII